MVGSEDDEIFDLSLSYKHPIERVLMVQRQCSGAQCVTKLDID